MKKSLALLIIAVLLTGCAKQESAPSESAPPPATQQTRQMQTAAPETATVEPTADDRGNVAESVVYRELSYYESLDESREVERYKRTYDADGNVLTFVKTYESRDGTVAYENSGEYKYDEQGRVVSMEERYANGEIVLTEYTFEIIESAE